MSTVKDKVGFCVAQVRKYPRAFPPYVWEDVKRRGYDDFTQNLFIEVLSVRNDDFRGLFRALSRAFYRTARELGWRKQRDGRWVPELHWDVLPVVDWV